MSRRSPILTTPSEIGSAACAAPPKRTVAPSAAVRMPLLAMLPPIVRLCLGQSETAVVAQGRDHPSRFGNLFEVDLRGDDADALAGVGQDLAPGRDDEGVAVGL